jgi:hypothetical protein
MRITTEVIAVLRIAAVRSREVAVTTAVNSVVKYAQEPNPHMNYPGDLPDLKDANLFNTAIIEADDSPSRIKASPPE